MLHTIAPNKSIEAKAKCEIFFSVLNYIYERKVINLLDSLCYIIYPHSFNAEDVS